MIATPGSATLPFDVHGSGPGVVLLHAGVTDRRGWAPLLPVLRPDHRVVAFDARGFGESSYEPEPFSRATDAVAVMDAADLGPAVLIGNSMGGKTAIDVAIDHPDRVTALVLIGAPISGAPQGEDDPPEVRALWEEMKDAEEAEDLDALNRLEARFWLDGVPAPEGRVTGATRDLFLEMNGRALAAPDPGEEDRSSVAWTGSRRSWSRPSSSWATSTSRSSNGSVSRPRRGSPAPRSSGSRALPTYRPRGRPGLPHRHLAVRRVARPRAPDPQ